MASTRKAAKALSRSAPAIVACLLAAACGDETPPPQYVGKVAGSDAVVGAVTDGENVQFYLCGGPSTYSTLTKWFTGPVGPGGALDLETDGFELTGDLAKGSGQVRTAGGETLPWSVTPASGALGGLWSAETSTSCRTGAVVGDFEGDGQMHLQGTWCGDVKDVFAQVTPIMPWLTDERGIAVRVETDPAQNIFVARVWQP
jgi:hypothetical protein